MKKFLLFIQVFCACVAYSQNCQDYQQTTHVYALPLNHDVYKPGWDLVIEDEFNSPLDPGFWHIWGPGYVGDLTLAGYVLPTNYEISNGTIKLKTVAHSPFLLGNDGRYYDYSGMWIDSQQDWGPGYYYEVRCKRNSLGSKSSWWFFNYATFHDIDVFDNDFTYPGDLTYIHQDYGENDLLTRRSFDIYYDQNMPAQDQAFYTYAVDWRNSNCIKIYVNNRLVSEHGSFDIDAGKLSFWSMPLYWKDTVLRAEGVFEIDYLRIYEMNCELTTAADGYGMQQGFNNQDERPRMMADVNGDGMQDIVAFGWQYTIVALANGNGTFSSPQYVLQGFTKEQSWLNQETYPRVLADVNGDGKADIVGFGPNNNTVVSLSTSSGSIASYGAAQVVFANYTTGQGYTNQNIRPRFLADVNSDGKKDIVAFGVNYTSVAISNCAGNSVAFTSPQNVIQDFTVEQGWTNLQTYPRNLADVNWDGKADIIGFGFQNTMVSLSSSSGSTATFGSIQSPFSAYCVNQGYSNQLQYPRMIADINNDGKNDIVAFHSNAVYASLSASSGSSVSFTQPQALLQDYTIGQGWTSTDAYPRVLADVNSDGMADIIGFGHGEVRISASKSTSNTASFSDPQDVTQDFSTSKGWVNQSQYPRFVCDLTGDGASDIVGFNYGVVNSFSCLNSTFELRTANPALTGNSFTQDSIAAETHNVDVSIFPNPSSGSITVSDIDNLEFNAIEVYNSIGQKVCSQEIHDTSLTFTLYDKGLYYVVVSGNNNRVVKKVIIQ